LQAFSQFKLAVIVYRAVQCTAPWYLVCFATSLICHREVYFGRLLLDVRRSRLGSVGDHSFLLLDHGSGTDCLKTSCLPVPHHW